MTDTKQPEALRLAEILEGDYCPDWFYEQGVDEVAAELRRLHAENTTLQQGYDAARLEIDGLHARVQELGAMLRQQLEAIGAGGVEPLRSRLHQIEHDHFRDVTKMVTAQSAPAAAPAPHPAPVAQGAAYVDADRAMRAAQPEGAQQSGTNPELLKFYGATTDAELIAAQAAHIEKLQAKLTKTPSFAPQRVREG